MFKQRKPRIQPARVARAICSRFLAGESPTSLACDYDIRYDEVLATLRAWMAVRGEARKRARP